MDTRPAKRESHGFSGGNRNRESYYCGTPVQHDADVNFPAEFGVKRTPLQRATELGNVEFIQLLLERGADVSGPAVLRGGGTAPQFAAVKGYVPTALYCSRMGP